MTDLLGAIKHGKRLVIGLAVLLTIGSIVYLAMFGYETEVMFAVTAIIGLAASYFVGFAIETLYQEGRI